MLAMLLYVVTLLLAISVSLWIYRGRGRGRGREGGSLSLPPGSKGYPLIGETLQLIIPSYSLDLPHFITTRTKRYGPVFRTHLVGRPTVVSADPDFNRYVIQQEGKAVEMWYLDTFSKLFAHDGDGRTNEAGYVHKYIRNATLGHFGSDALRQRLLPLLQHSAAEALRTWSTQPSTEVKNAVLTMVVDSAAKQLFGYDSDTVKEKIASKFIHLLEGFLSFPINIPGTAYHKCLKNRKAVTDVIRATIKERLSTKYKCDRADFLDQLLKDQAIEKFLSEDIIINIVFGLLLAASASTAVALALVLKFLSENHRALEELKVEHETIMKNRENPGSPLTWNEVKSMTFTLDVINESLRLGNPSFGLLRRALQDLRINRYTIPAGWTIMLITSASQYNPTIFKDPLSFNPWRWRDLEPDVISKNFMPFGGGTRQCAGAEFSKVLMAIFLHVLVTKYRWKKIKGGNIARTPIVVFPNGLHIKVVEQNS
ncbi:hypothetical protein Nepgr_015349 [Nepenthes gracilis]|uniref:Cytochrome P450 n=1 Tax=Nepenthes gracilis TaxID=150966 RepID=A0AAD3SLJ7_NEPGR|nr:hypothetical protein Nepgr_015349 [Nepenthes gracilis]